MDRWDTAFGTWVREYGVAKLRRSLNVTRGAVYWWVAGSVNPAPEYVRQMVTLSKGRLTMEDIYRQATLCERWGVTPLRYKRKPRR